MKTNETKIEEQEAGKPSDGIVGRESTCYVPKPIQLDLRKAWRLIHLEGKYKEGMSIIIDLSGMPESRIDWEAHNV